jgi:hypothetical protein
MCGQAVNPCVSGRVAVCDIEKHIFDPGGKALFELGTDGQFHVHAVWRGEPQMANTTDYHLALSALSMPRRGAVHDGDGIAK